MKPDNLVADRLREARIRKGLTQAEVAESLGITAQAISNFERGKGSLSLQNLNALCALYGIDPSTLNEQTIPETDNISALIRELTASSYALDPELLVPVTKCLGSFCVAVDGILRQYNFLKESFELSRSVASFNQKYLSASTSLQSKIARVEGMDSILDAIGDYEQAVIKSSPEALMKDVTINSQNKVIHALDTLSKNLQAMLEKDAQNAQNALLGAHSTSSDAE